MKNKLPGLVVFLALVLIGLLTVAVVISMGRPDVQSGGDDPVISTEQGGSAGETSTDSTADATTVPTTAPTEPPIVKESVATIGATGDVLMHGNVINSGKTGSGYNYDNIFTYFGPYAAELDYAAFNLETTLCGADNGYEYNGYPCFNAPDAIAEALKAAGFDLMLTANNHTYDTRTKGFHRTQSVAADLGFDWIGTQTTTEEPNYTVREIDGVKVGMICYTYNTGVNQNGSVSLNGIPLSVSDSELINTFDYDDLDGFYEKLSAELTAMEDAGAEATILFIHWGNEYQLSANSTQKAMAQELCDLGIDVIIGGHPHVIQPMELLTNSTDPEQKTVCLYSLGNCVSNQRLGLISSIKTAHTEDGMLFSVSFAKYSDGTVVLENVELLPTWVNMNTNSGSKVYEIVPLDTAVTDWKTAFHMTDSQLREAKASYERTMKIVGDGLAQVQTWCKENQAAVENSLGVSEK